MVMEKQFDFSLHTAFRVVENVSKKYFEEGFGTDTQETSRKPKQPNNK
jgi:probable transcriptional regulator